MTAAREHVAALSDEQLAHRLAESAGAVLLGVQGSGLFANGALGKAGDKVANTFIIASLQDARPGDAILSEEEKADAARLGASRVWIVDPLDGTREFSEHRTDWAVHIALSIDGRPAVGAVGLPGLGLVLSSAAPQSPPPRGDRPLRMLVSRTRPAKEAVEIAEALGAELLPMGSAGAKAMAVLRGEADIYLHSGGQYEWDNCAPAAVALAAGLHASRTDGAPLRYNQPEASLPDVLICRPELAERVLALYARVSQRQD